MGTDGDGDGIIARAVRDLFLHKSKLKNGDDRVRITMSYLEIYNERAVDLLAESDEENSGGNPSGAALQVRDSAEGVVVQNLRHFEVGGPSEVKALMERASARRATGSTNMNAVSSRSHAICTLNVTVGPDVSGGEEEGTNAEDKRNSTGSAGSSGSNDGGGPGAAIRAKLTLVDLAGSERAKRTGAEGARLREGININKGLFVLGQVVSALSELGQGGVSPKSAPSAVSHIPYRDSKLTRLLQDSLGGNSRTVMIACVSPAPANVEESVNTLRYAERTRNIKNLAVRNVVSSGCSAAKAAALRRENARLRSDVARLESRLAAGGGPVGSFLTMAMPSGGNEMLNDNAQLHALLAENETLRESSSRHAREILEASVRADRWQARAEAVIDEAKSRGVELSSGNGELENETGNIVARLRSELEGCRAELREARTDAAVARAVSGAVLSSGGNVDDLAPSDLAAASAESEEADGDGASEQITSELSAVSATIEQKEAIVAAMARERACRDGLQQHFEASLRALLQEVDGLTAERDALETRIASSTNNHHAQQQPHRRKRGAAAASDPATRKLKEQVTKLERRISDLKSKAAQHRSAIKMKDEAERKCVRLMAEIADDKRRRADLQRKLKEASQERREERNAAKKDAARMMKDSSRLKIELQKMRSTAAKQAAVLKRKIDQAAAKERQRMELERKRRSAGRMRLSSSSSNEPSGDVGEERRAELTEWIDRELEHGTIRTEIDEQKRQLDSAVGERRRLLKNAGTEEKPSADFAEELGQIERTITSLRSTVQDLESAAARAFPPPPSSSLAGPTFSSASSAFRFLQTDVFRGLSKADAKFVLGYLYDACAEGRRDLASLVDRQEVDVKLRVDSALVKEREEFDRELARAKVRFVIDCVGLTCSKSI